MISNHPRIVREAGAQVKCRMCGCEFRIRSRRQRRCPDCGAVEMWFTLKETWHCIDCGKDFELNPDAPLCEQVPGHTYGSDDLQLRHPTLDDLADDREVLIKEGM